MKATTPKPQKKSTARIKKAAKSGQIMAAASTRTSAVPKAVPAWVRKEVKGLMDALSGR